MPPPVVIPPSLALIRAKRMLSQLGYFKISASGGSSYFGKLGTHHKIRVSDHVNPQVRHDFVYSITFTSPTIMNDVRYQVERADREFKIAVTGKKVAG